MLRVGGVLAVAGLALALVAEPRLAVLGGALMAAGGCALAVGMEAILSAEDRRTPVPARDRDVGSELSVERTLD
jgi:hypothetical protein